MKKIISSTKNFVWKHKTVLGVAGGLTTVVVMQQKGIKSLNEFLKENNLFEKYYTE